MELQATWLILALFHASFGQLTLKKEYLAEQNKKMCAKMAENPYFDIQQVVDKSWRLYYTWNIVMESKCVDITFRNATSSIVTRIYNDMHDYISKQPIWDAATMLVHIGPSKHELLMLADIGAAGYFSGVPNVVRGAAIAPARNSVPLMTFYLKLLNQGKYLLLADCNIGVVSLSTHEKPPYRAEIAELVKQLNLGQGVPMCLTDKRKDEHVGVIDE